MLVSTRAQVGLHWVGFSVTDPGVLCRPGAGGWTETAQQLSGLVSLMEKLPVSGLV